MTRLGENQRQMLKDACLTEDMDAWPARPKGHVTIPFARQYYSENTDVKHAVLEPLADGTKHRSPVLEFTGVLGLYRIIRLPHDLKHEIKTAIKNGDNQ